MKTYDYHGLRVVPKTANNIPSWIGFGVVWFLESDFLRAKISNENQSPKRVALTLYFLAFVSLWYFDSPFLEEELKRIINYRKVQDGGMQVRAHQGVHCGVWRPGSRQEVLQMNWNSSTIIDAMTIILAVCKLSNSW